MKYNNDRMYLFYRVGSPGLSTPSQTSGVIAEAPYSAGCAKVAGTLVSETGSESASPLSSDVDDEEAESDRDDDVYASGVAFVFPLRSNTFLEMPSVLWPDSCPWDDEGSLLLGAGKTLFTWRRDSPQRHKVSWTSCKTRSLSSIASLVKLSKRSNCSCVKVSGKDLRSGGLLGLRNISASIRTRC